MYCVGWPDFGFLLLLLLLFRFFVCPVCLAAWLQVGVGCSMHTCAGDCWSGTCTLVLETAGLVRADVWFTYLSEGERGRG